MGAINPEFDRVLAATSIARARSFLDGIKAYQRHSAQRDIGEAPILWQAGTTMLRDYNPAKTDAPVVLVIPSLINRFDILDLDRNHSFLRHLAERGLRPLVVDWDEPGEEEENFALANYINERLLPILEALVAAGTPVHLLGYCMGGNMALALASLRPAVIRTLTLLATPWDFHQPDANIGPQFSALAAQMEPYLQKLHHLPVDIIQSAFAVFQPMQVLTKFMEFASLDQDSLEARNFVLCEDWLNDGVPLAAPVARECFNDWYGKNLPGKTAWRVNDIVIDPRKLEIPTYIVAAGKDRIVPPESALPLAKLLPHATLHQPMTGHIGMFASPKAPLQVWSSHMSWLEQHK